MEIAFRIILLIIFISQFDHLRELLDMKKWKKVQIRVKRAEKRKSVLLFSLLKTQNFIAIFLIIAMSLYYVEHRVFAKEKYFSLDFPHQCVHSTYLNIINSIIWKIVKTACAAYLVTCQSITSIMPGTTNRPEYVMINNSRCRRKISHWCWRPSASQTIIMVIVVLLCFLPYRCTHAFWVILIARELRSQFHTLKHKSKQIG